ncbi:haloacid dehalogenase superfamily, subfamily IA, variant 1 with third motif having Dx(3-4)D or Dx(3-4)E [Thermomonospora echinospora]|uniref:Haloacid dehalogenase superfamily, subfamily IA, variant 1 with third motif having Dx(3-4)D or Dx(3-4)E n=1 Tax=Thermomonospora echinospora TaxID=1992 RepID=A0A1H5W1Z5_9ACTN|nr:HAD family hydrolase [Thermomonospora echinospora]SEF93522.1 haloacid dehalogenase superfamily, subfamily IA, variant 1 with third motif having Dx(3-4)D or Dx(3-4)E [Thermomonospora echinospora]
MTTTGEATGDATGGADRAPIRAVFFDIGETLINEGEIYGRWADWLGVPRHTFLTKLGALLATGGTHLDLLEYFRPGFDLDKEERRRAEAGVPNGFGAEDLYFDARRCLAGLRAQGLYVGVAGNQPVQAAEQFAALGLEADVVGISDVWGVSKPSPEFFARCAAECGLPPGDILYVGDRIDNDVRPALAFGMRAAFLRRGPWGHIQHDERALRRCTFVLDDLVDLPALVERHNAP